MNANSTHTKVFNGNHRRGSAIVLAAAVALYTLAATPAMANPGREIPRPAPRHDIPRVQIRPHTPAIFNNAVSAVTGAIRNANLDIPGRWTDRTKKDKGERDKKLKEELKDKISDLEKEFLASEDGKDAKKKLDEEKKKLDKKLKDARAERDKKYKAKKAKNDDDNACCVYTPDEIVAADTAYLIQVGDAHDDFDEAKKKAVGDGLKKSDPKKYKEYKQARADLDKVKKAEPKVSVIDTSDGPLIDDSDLSDEPEGPPVSPFPPGGPIVQP